MENLIHKPNSLPITNSSTTEAEFKQLYLENCQASENQLQNCIVSGLISDRMSWVFMGAYQACIQHVFGTKLASLSPTNAWHAFAGSEPKDKPGLEVSSNITEYSKSVCLNGHKGWVAGANCIDGLIVSARDAHSDAGWRYFWVPKSRGGLSLNQKSAPRSLVELSQAEATFSNLEILTSNEILDVDKRLFSATECLFVFTSFVSSAFRQLHSSAPEASERLQRVLIDLSRCIPDSSSMVATLSMLDQELDYTISRLQEAKVSSPLIVDLKVLEMYRMGLKRLIS